jgi:hypothetical protein
MKGENNWNWKNAEMYLIVLNFHALFKKIILQSWKL